MRPKIFHVKCPPPPNDSILSNDKISERIKRIAHLSGQNGADIFFGMEIRTAFYYESISENADLPPDPSIRRYFYRFAIEPYLYSLRDNLSLPILSESAINSFMTALCGQNMQPRQTSSRSIPTDDGSHTVYPNPVYARKYIERINTYRLGEPLSQALYIFAETICSHPYVDRNGRLSRALMFASLGRDLNLPFFDLPFGPVAAANADLYLKALQHLGTEGDWQAYAMMMHAIITECLEIVEAKWQITD